MAARPPRSQRAPWLWFLGCGLVSLFCAVALGLGPLLLGAVGVLITAAGFRRRRELWWGLGLAVAGATVVLAAVGGWGVATVVEVAVLSFWAVTGARAFARRPVGPRA